MSHPVRWPRLAIATLLAAIGLAGFLSLGIWQVQRLYWKLDLIERVDARVTADPVPAPGPADWPEITREDDEYTRVRLSGEYLHDEEVFDLPVELHNPKHRKGTSYRAVYGRMHGDRPAGTITTGFLTPGRGRYVHPTRRRTLNPREAARLQGFPDTYRFEVDGERPSSAQLTKWIGDAVPMPLGYAAAMSALAEDLPVR